MCKYHYITVSYVIGITGAFNVTGGNLGWFPILDGALGGNYYDRSGNPLWCLELGLGSYGSMVFYFEDLAKFFNSNPDHPNDASRENFVLWGQNLDAYRGCNGVSKQNDCSPLGIDSFARAVPEPGTLAMLALGLLAIGFGATRRRRATAV